MILLARRRGEEALYQALVSILRVVSTHSRLPFEDDASDRYEKRDIVRGHPEVSGDIFSIIFWQVRQQ